MADKKNLFKRLYNLFSSNVVVRNIGKNKVKIVDTSRQQSSGNPFSKKNEYGSKMYGNRDFHNRGYQYGSSLQNKILLYGDYELMDDDAIISSALDIFADESTLKHTNGSVVNINTEHGEVKDILDNLFNDILNVEFTLWGWVRNLCKYGDFYLYLDIQEKIGVTNVIPLSSYDVERIDGDEENPYQTTFIYEGMRGRDAYENFQIAHFRMVGDTNFLPYGKSMIEGARKIYKQLHLMEDAMMIHRISRAPEKRAYYIDVGNIPPDEVDNYMEQIVNETKKTPIIDNVTGQYNLDYNTNNMLEDYYFAVRGDKSGTRIENLPGLTYEAIEDIEYLKAKMFAALKVPKSFLTFDDGLDGKAVLAQQDIRFARTIQRIQRVIVSELYKIAIVHLYTQGYRDSQLVDFELELNNPSIIFEREQMDLLEAQIRLARDMRETKMLSKDKIYKELFKMTKHEIEDEKEKVIDDLKEDFRFQQIQDEGNDPVKTNESFGTKGDMLRMQMQMAKLNKGLPKEMPDDGWENSGRPKKGNIHGTDDSPFGRDPIGRKAVQQSLNREKTENKNTNYKKHIIKELFKKDKKNIENEDKGTFLDPNELK
jgi:hypothetical protein